MLKRRGLIALLTLALAACSQQTAPVSPSQIDQQTISGTNIDTWRKQVIYLLIPDRFSNGNTANDNAGAANCFDPASGTKFHGGDLQGVRNKISYIKSLGATTVWTTPVYKQVGLVGSSCGYHGYWANFTNNAADTSVEPKLGSSSDLTGLISDLHLPANNMKFMMDMVVNHAGYGATVASTNPTWFHSNCTGNDITCPLSGLPDFA
ncbi:alpha-amylase family glycosyl hydrolase, partial [Deinococcus roseus]|uniref:alpha-amylase family glycosyl hydrolase n=1 Tax=Deinococcus roseus TaxID=392414 RepID=UPI00227A2E1C